MLMAITAHAQHEYVDLGLPSGTLWATTNIGAINPADYGDYFAWGEKETKSNYDWSTYKWCKGSESTLTKYCTDNSYGYNGFTDGLTRILPEDDAATANWGSNWQMPTKVQFEELISSSYTTTEWTSKTGKEGFLNYGLLITSKSNGNSIFLPASGERVETYSASGVDTYGDYWSRDNKSAASYVLQFNSKRSNSSSLIFRNLGLSIRPVYVPHYKTCPDNNHPHLIDLGLPSGAKWSCCNLGASTPETFGDYFAWGETVPKNDYTWSNYKWCKGSDHKLTKYCPSNSSNGYNGFADDLTELMPEDDAATANWGGEWQMPSKEQMEELLNSSNTTVKWTQNGYENYGFLITSKSNGNSIFLPAGGCYGENSNHLPGSDYPKGFYWARTINSSLIADGLWLNQDEIETSGNYRYAGQSVRPVRSSDVVYSEFVETTGTLTFYYDNKRYSRTGVTELFDPNTSLSKRFIGYNDKVLKVVINSSMKNASMTSMKGLFYNLNAVTSIEGLQNLNTQNVTDMGYMFWGCTSLSTLDLSSFNTQNVTDMSNMFFNCGSLTIIFSSSDWSNNGAKSVDMFSSCISLAGGKGTTYDESLVDATYARPDGGKANPGYFTLPIPVYTVYNEATQTLTYYCDENYDASNPYHELYDPMNAPDAVRFTGYYRKVKKAVIDPSMKDAPLISMYGMFFGGIHNETYAFQTLSNMTTIEGMENLNTANVTRMDYMFEGCSALQTVDVSSFDISKVTKMDMMFSDCNNLTTIYCATDWSTSTATSSNMFYGCTSLVGGEGTTYNSSYKDKTYARPDGGKKSPGYFTDSTILKGDADGDGKVTAADIVAMTNYIMGNPPADFSKANADINLDGVIDIADIVAVSNIILND